ncbi:AMIN-like domain-containing (lipo)protein [Thermoactinospora rubra]|uniref:AMIN-like domain-containing (lipo)protein n=1 Tax=Thermoactinospora rubra TaxID=1088767 RepID=UPI000A10ABC9|nr:hypothetical protein [Thermoactinospora rubra]
MRHSRIAGAVAGLVGLVGLAVLAGCGTAGPGGTTGTSSATATAPAPATAEGSTPADPARPSPAALPVPTSTKEVKVTRGGEPALLTDVRFARHDGFDRVVIDFRGEVPGYTVEWVEEFVEDGSGRELEVPAGAYLHIRLHPANAHTDDGEPTWPGGPIFKADLGNVRSVVRTGDFEAYVGVGLALDRRAGFRVRELTGPDRLVVDVGH